MKKILCLLFAFVLCLGLVGCNGGPNSADTNDDTDETDGIGDTDTMDNEYVYDTPANKNITLAVPYDTTKCDLAEIIGSGSDFKAFKDGEELDGTEVKLSVGKNMFRVIYTVSYVERICDVRIARRDGYRVVFNSNGGSFVEALYVEDAAVIDDAKVVPTRDRYNFMGWYNEDGEKVTLSETPIVRDRTFVARWEGPYNYVKPDQSVITYETSSAALNINWKDYDNAFMTRPDEVLCTLKDIKTDTAYTVKVTRHSAEFVGEAPKGASIAQGAGIWTVKITGLPKDSQYSFVMNDLGSSNYTTVQSGTSVINTMKNYSPLTDDSAALMTMNGRFYDLGGNLVVLKGVVPWNVNQNEFNDSTSLAAMERMKNEGCSAIRITMPLGSTQGYNTPGKKEVYVPKMKEAVERITGLGLYCIIDWGVMANDEKDAYLEGLLPSTKEFFGTMATAFADNPYVIYELANEPTATSWEKVLRPWEETLIRHIRNIDTDAVIIAAPNMHSRRLSEPNGDDPIEKPFPTDISYNVAYTFHCYAYTTTYNVDYGDERKDAGGMAVYGWRVCEAVKNGLAIVITEFSPANGSMSVTGGTDKNGLDADYVEADKWLNLILENDLNYTLFRFAEKPSSENKVPAQFMFTQGNEDTAYKGAWTVDMLSESGKWYYDGVLNATGFIKAADFDAKTEIGNKG